MALLGNIDVDRFFLFLLLIVFTLVAGNVLSASLRKYFKLKGKRSWIYLLIPKIVLYAVYLMGFYYALDKVIRFDVKAFAAAFGLISLVVAFSSQQTLQNIISGLIIIFDRPIQEREYVELNGMLCKIEDISLRKTRLRSVDGRVIIAPNSLFVTGTVTNYSRSLFYRITTTIPIQESSDLEKAKNIIYQVAIEHPDIVPRTQPKKKTLIQIMLDIPANIEKFAPRIWVKEITKDKTVLEVWCWIGNIRSRERILSELLLEVRKQFDAQGIKFG